MRLDREAAPAGPVVQGFAGSGFRIGGTVYPHGVKLAPEAAWPWNAPALDALEPAMFDDLCGADLSPEFLLLGTGSTLRRPALSLIGALEARGVGVELMDSRAAARAWGVLRGEGRRVVAALLPLDAS